MNEEMQNVEMEFDENTVYAKVIKDEEGYKVVDFDGSIGPVCKVTTDQKWIALTENKANRQWLSLAKAEAEIAKNGEMALYYKATKKYGPIGDRLPNAKLISYLSEEDQAEYKEIIERAKAAKAADRVKPLTEREKLERKIASAKAALAKLEAEQAE